MNQKKSVKLNGVIARYAVLAGATTKKAQAEQVIMDRMCYARRLSNPGNFTLDELEKVSKAFKIPWSEIAEALA